MLIVGAVLLGLAVVAVLAALYQRGRWYLMAVTETLTVAQLRDEVATSGQLGGGSGYTRACEVTGAARPGPDGPLTAKFSRVTCVWHRHVVRRRYWQYVTDSDGNRRRQQKTQQVSDFTSGAPFTVVDQTGSILVDPGGARIDQAERVANNFLHGEASQSLAELGISLLLGDRRSGETIGYEHEEWVVRPGTQLYVLGEVTAPAGELRMGKPATGKFMISTRTEAELTASARRLQRGFMVGAAVAAVAGVATATAGLIMNLGT